MLSPLTVLSGKFQGHTLELQIDSSDSIATVIAKAYEQERFQLAELALLDPNSAQRLMFAGSELQVRSVQLLRIQQRTHNSACALAERSHAFALRHRASIDCPSRARCRYRGASCRPRAESGSIRPCTYARLLLPASTGK